MGEEVRESSLAQRERQDAEKAAYVKARQVRLGDVPEESEEKESKPKAKPKASASKKTE